jgi:hypothetical protein
MPLRRYFLAGGGVLLALLFVANALLPEPPANDTVHSGASSPVIRIHSERKGPEAVVLDTSQPTIVPAASAVATAGTAPPASHVRDSFAQLVPPQPQHVKGEAKKAEPRLSPKRKVAAARVKHPRMFAAQPPFFGFFNTTW